LRATIDDVHLDTMIGKAFDLTGNILKLSKADQ
jgi:hypothetical protein